METIKINKLLSDEEVLEKQKELEKQGKVVIAVKEWKLTIKQNSK